MNRGEEPRFLKKNHLRRAPDDSGESLAYQAVPIGPAIKRGGLVRLPENRPFTAFYNFSCFCLCSQPAL